VVTTIERPRRTHAGMCVRRVKLPLRVRGCSLRGSCKWRAVRPHGASRAVVDVRLARGQMRGRETRCRRPGKSALGRLEASFGDPRNKPPARRGFPVCSVRTVTAWSTWLRP
jgi:hypothetical protein